MKNVDSTYTVIGALWLVIGMVVGVVTGGQSQLSVHARSRAHRCYRIRLSSNLRNSVPELADHESIRPRPLSVLDLCAFHADYVDRPRVHAERRCRTANYARITGIGGGSGPVLLHDLAGAQRQLTAAGACVAASIACDSPGPSVEFAHLAGSRLRRIAGGHLGSGEWNVSPATQQSYFQSILCRGCLALIGAAGFAPAPFWHGGAHVRKPGGLRVHNR